MKREAGQKIHTRQQNINNLDDLEKAVVNLKNIKITKISSEKVFERAAQLELKELFENTLPVPKITQCHFILPVNGVIETKLYTSQSEDDPNRDTTEQDEIMEEEMEPDLSTLPPTWSNCSSTLAWKKQNIANVYMAMVSFFKLN